MTDPETTDDVEGSLLSGPTDEHFMNLALVEAVKAYEDGEVPVGAVIAKNGKVVGRAHNLRETLNDPTAHAEMIAITQAAEAVEQWRLEDCTLYVTLEPCPMCAGAIVNSRIPRVVYATTDPKAGACGSLFNLVQDSRLNHRVELENGLKQQEASELLKNFFREARNGTMRKRPKE
ncbi:MAG: tRNA adenosine(34) deaminase TadA [Planctomycetota bacterium]|jgi:tRNA(adenine34) deaminase